MHILKKTSMMLVWAIALVLSSCSAPSGLAEDAPADLENIQSKVLDSQVYYSEMAPVTHSVYAMQVNRLQDGSVTILRGTTPYNPSFQVSRFVVDGATDIQPKSGEMEVSFDSDAWFVPFDPGEPIQGIPPITYTTFWCNCYGKGDCSVGMIYIHESGGTKFDCESIECVEDCIPHVRQTSFLIEGSGLLIKAPSVQLL